VRALLACVGILVSSVAIVTASAQSASNIRAFVLGVDRQGSFFVAADDAPLRLDDASVVQQAAAALRRDAGTALVVEADEGAPYDSVTRAAQLLQQAGATQIGFRTRNASQR
jgi:biopolymer transport protein ExbD